MVKLENRTDLGLEYHIGARTINPKGKYAVITANLMEPHKSIDLGAILKINDSIFS